MSKQHTANSKQQKTVIDHHHPKLISDSALSLAGCLLFTVCCLLQD
jgi:hypothetical protein